MNANQAKQIRLDELMARLGHKVVNRTKGGQELWYMSPFREETESSFSIHIGKNVFYDLGEAYGSGTLDFAIRYLESRGQGSSVSDALRFLSEKMGQSSLLPRTLPDKPNSQSFSFGQQEKFAEGEIQKLQFLKAIPIQNRRIYEYLQGRGINKKIADMYLKEIHYRNLEKSRDFWGFGMANLSKDGFEVRSAGDDPVFKTAFKRDISVLEGFGENKAVNVFEGMLDALSLLEVLKTTKLASDSIIMHSLSSFQRTCAYILAHGYTTINLFLDNNKSGINSTKRFFAIQEPVTDQKIRLKERYFFPEGIRIVNRSELYAPHIDLNDAHRAGDSDVKRKFTNPEP